jgi:cell pole-organizing protein PopZ
MTDAPKDQDQSMEEILQSIKRIIAEEGEPSSQASDVLELNDIVGEDEVALNPSELTIDEIMAASTGQALEHMIPKDDPLPAAPEPVVVPEDIILSEDVVVPQPTVAVEPPIVASAEGVDEPDDALISEATLASAAAAFDVLKKIPADMPLPRNNSMRFRSGETVEDLVMESLKPMLREWFDDHLTELVERLVEREVRKITAR